MNRLRDITYHISANCGIYWYGLLCKEISIFYLTDYQYFVLLYQVLIYFGHSSPVLIRIWRMKFCHFGTRFRSAEDQERQYSHESTVGMRDGRKAFMSSPES